MHQRGQVLTSWVSQSRPGVINQDWTPTVSLTVGTSLPLNEQKPWEEISCPAHTVLTLIIEL